MAAACRALAVGTSQPVMPQHSHRFGFDLPDDFPLVPLTAVHERVSDGAGSIHARDQALWGHWGGGCNGTMYRFIAAAEASDRWAASSALSISPEINERVRQDL